MDKSTLSNYGWIVIAVLVLSVMIALATPFGSYIEQGVRATTEGLFDTSKNAVNTAFEDLGVQMEDQEFEEGYNSVNKTPTIELPAKGKTLEEYTWAEVRDIIATGKAIEYGFAVGGTKTLSINGATKTATIIGLNHDGSNTATFMVMNSIATLAMTSSGKNAGGWEQSTMCEWLNSTVLNSMSNKNQIKTVNKKTNNTGYQPTSVTKTSDSIFLLSPIECGFDCPASYEEYSALFNAEGSVYEWFNEHSTNTYIWLRSATATNQKKELVSNVYEFFLIFNAFYFFYNSNTLFT